MFLFVKKLKHVIYNDKLNFKTNTLITQMKKVKKKEHYLPSYYLSYIITNKQKRIVHKIIKLNVFLVWLKYVYFTSLNYQSTLFT